MAFVITFVKTTNKIVASNDFPVYCLSQFEYRLVDKFVEQKYRAHESSIIPFSIVSVTSFKVCRLISVVVKFIAFAHLENFQ